MRLVITSVHYGDCLASTLGAWQRFADGRVIVATSPDDVETQDVARRHGAELHVTDAYTRRDPTCHDGGDPAVNVALGIDEAMGILAGDVREGEVCAHANPDLYPFGAVPDERDIAPGVVYGFKRFECPSPEALADHVAGRSRVEDLVPPKPVGKNPNPSPKAGGYFQLFRWRPGIRFGSYPTAGKFDMTFARKFAREHQWPVAQCYALHLGGRDKRNWAGRVLPRWPNQERATC